VQVQQAASSSEASPASSSDAALLLSSSGSPLLQQQQQQQGQQQQGQQQQHQQPRKVSLLSQQIACARSRGLGFRAQQGPAGSSHEAAGYERGAGSTHHHASEFWRYMQVGASTCSIGLAVVWQDVGCKKSMSGVVLTAKSACCCADNAIVACWWQTWEPASTTSELQLAALVVCHVVSVCSAQMCS
jgi:hypothetical protein